MVNLCIWEFRWEADDLTFFLFDKKKASAIVETRRTTTGKTRHNRPEKMKNTKFDFFGSPNASINPNDASFMQVDGNDSLKNQLV